MSDIAGKLVRINDTRKAIRQKLLDKNVDIPAGTPFVEYPGKIDTVLPAHVVPYKRSDSWLQTPVSEAQQVNLLFRVNPEPTYIALSISGTDYTVDWGDGTIQTYLAGTVAQYIYDYNDIDPDTEVSGYRQAIIRIAAEGTGVITGVNLGHRHTGTNSIIGYILEIDLNAPDCSSLLFATETTGVVHSYCENVTVRQIGVVTSLDSLCLGFRSLATFNVPDNFFTHVTTMGSTFRNCNSLRKLTFPPGSLTQVTNLRGAFAVCYLLTEIVFPANSLALVTSLESTFSGCTHLRSVTFPENSLSLVNTLAFTFSSCLSLESLNFPDNSLSLVTTTESAFSSCLNLPAVEFPAGSLAQTTNCASTFISCTALKTIVLPPLPAVTTMRLMFNAAPIESITLEGPFNSLTIIESAFRSCRDLKHITFTHPLSSVTDARNAFDGCLGLETLTLATPSFTSVTLVTTMFTTPKLKQITNLGVRVSFSLANNNLSAAALNTIYTSLPTVTGQTLTVTGNPGTTGHNISIANAKGWTIVQ